MTAVQEGRTLIKTETPGWFVDPATGKKTRKQPGDNLLTRDEYEATLEQAKPKPKAAAEPKQTTKLSSGKTATSATTVVRCAWVDPENRTAAQQKLFDAGDKDKLTYDAVKKAAGASQAAQPDGREIVVKAQDAFQVRFSAENQRKWRNEQRRRLNAARRQARNGGKGK